MPVSNQGPVPRGSLSDVVYERLRNEILLGELEDGSTISQVRLAASYGVSRLPIREALRRLQAESLVVATPFHPFVVSKVSSGQVVELIDIRNALEDLALSRRNEIADEDITRLRQINEQMTKAKVGAPWFQLDRDFHRVLAGHSSLIVEMIEDVRDRVRRYSDAMVLTPPGRTTATLEHSRIIDALEAHDTVSARRELHQHLVRSREFIKHRLRDPAKPALRAS